MERKKIQQNYLTMNLMPGCNRFLSCLISSLANIQDNRVGANNTEMTMSSLGRIITSKLLVNRSSEPKVFWSYKTETINSSTKKHTVNTSSYKAGGGQSRRLSTSQTWKQSWSCPLMSSRKCWAVEAQLLLKTSFWSLQTMTFINIAHFLCNTVIKCTSCTLY